MFYGASHWSETGRAGSSKTPSAATRAMSSSCRKQVCSSEEDHCGSARSTAEDGGSVTQGAFRLYCFN